MILYMSSFLLFRGTLVKVNERRHALDANQCNHHIFTTLTPTAASNARDCVRIAFSASIVPRLLPLLPRQRCIQKQLLPDIFLSLGYQLSKRIRNTWLPYITGSLVVPTAVFVTSAA